MKIFKRRFAAFFTAAAVFLGSLSPAAAGQAAGTFSDVSPQSWYSEAVNFVSERGYLSGTSDSVFSPNADMTRAMFVTALGRMSGEDISAYNGDDFTDVSDSAWYAKSAGWAAEKGIISGVGGGRFDPSGVITREQMAAILYRYAKSAGADTASSCERALSGFSDKDDSSAYAKDALCWACEKGVLSGSAGKLLPKSRATRAQTAQIIKNYTEKILNPVPVNDEPVKSGAAPYNVMLSFTGDASDSATVTWRDAPGSSGGSVLFSEDRELLSDYINKIGTVSKESPASPAGVSAVSGTAVDISSGINIEESLWSAELTDLAPGREYYYSVLSSGGTGGLQSFRTAEKEQSDVAFAYLGDIQFSDNMENEYKDWGDMVSDMYKRNPDLAFALQGGDIVQSGIRSGEWRSFLNNASKVFSRLAFMTVNGNHESNFPGGKPELYTDMFTLPENGPAGFKEEFYSFDYGSCHITALNSWVFSGEQTISEKEFSDIADWIRSDLDSAGDKWKIVMMHHPVYAVASDRVAEQVKEKWAPIFESCGVNIVFCGHQHVYSRSYPMKAGSADYVNGITYIMGNSGQKFYSSADETFQEKTVYNTSTYQVVRVSGNSLELICYDKDGNELDYYTQSRQAGRAAA